MSNLKGVYWDLDGTIANTELEAHLPAFNKSFADLGLDWYWDELTYINLLKINGGKNRIKFYSDKKKLNISNEFIYKIHQEKQKHYLSLVKSGVVKLKTGVNRLINELSCQNVRHFIVTSSSKIQVNLLVDILFGQNNPFEFFVASEDVELHKPNPLPYHKAISLSGIDKSNTIVFEDSIPGVLSSLSAKIPTICVKSNIPTNFDKSIPIKCLIDTIGDEGKYSNVLIGPKLNGNFINFDYLNKVLEFN
tara:strand:- start:2027 stop:2773 length:747 start_codon:yes stop_codon:yes gene_type:complete